MTVTKFDKTICAEISREAVAALAEVAAKYGLSVTGGGGTVGALGFDCKIVFTVQDANAAERENKAIWDKNAAMMRLNPNAFGWSFVNRGKTYKITGLNLSRPKFCIRAVEQGTGKLLFFPDTVVAMARP